MTTPLKDERHALNCHGVFLKKRVLEEVRKTAGMGVFAEEFGVTFNEPVAVDLISVDKREKRQLLFVFECKRAYAKEKTWIFFKDVDPTFRFCRWVSNFMQFGQYTRDLPIAPNPPVCSEGYELVASDKPLRADQNPIFGAGNQLCRGFLGFVRTRMDQKIRQTSLRDEVLDCIIPVLVTTAELRLAMFDVADVSLQSGNLEGKLEVAPQDWLILKQPFSVLSGTSTKDFRDDPRHEQDRQHWPQVHRESLFVVNAAKLPGFLSGGFREYMHGVAVG